MRVVEVKKEGIIVDIVKMHEKERERVEEKMKPLGKFKASLKTMEENYTQIKKLINSKNHIQLLNDHTSNIMSYVSNSSSELKLIFGF